MKNININILINDEIKEFIFDKNNLTTYEQEYLENLIRKEEPCDEL